MREMMNAKRAAATVNNEMNIRTGFLSMTDKRLFCVQKQTDHKEDDVI